MGAPGINGNNQFPNPSINHTEGRRSEGDDDKLVKKRLRLVADTRTHASTEKHTAADDGTRDVVCIWDYLSSVGHSGSLYLLLRPKSQTETKSLISDLVNMQNEM